MFQHLIKRRVDFYINDKTNYFFDDLVVDLLQATASVYVLHVLCVRESGWHVEVLIEVLFNDSRIIIWKRIIGEHLWWLLRNLSLMTVVIVLTQLLVYYVKVGLSPIHVLLAYARLWLLLVQTCGTVF